MGADQPGDRERTVIFKGQYWQRMELVIGLLVIACSVSDATQTKSPGDNYQTATVRIAVLKDQPTNLITGLRVLRFQQDGEKINFADHFENGFRKDKATAIPYGVYHAQIFLDGFLGAAEVTVKVNAPDVLVLIDARNKPPRALHQRPATDN
jgi:hypothetical protein